MFLIPTDLTKEINIRIDKTRNSMKKEGVKALLIASNTNIYYLSGRFFRGYIYLPLEGKPLWFVVKPQVFSASENTYLIRKPEEIPSILQNLGYPDSENIGLEENDLTYSDIIRLKNLFPDAQMKNSSILLKKTRMVKTDWEIEEMKKDGVHQVNVYKKIKDCYKSGMTDLQLQIEIEKELRLEGSLGISRVSGNLMEINMGSVISGENADNPAPYEFTMGGSGVDTSLPVGADNSVILKGTTVMIDMNGAFNGYQTDMTRVWSLGEISDLAVKAHNCSIQILRSLENMALPGVPVKNLYEEALRITEEYGLKDYFMGHRSQVGFIGHGVGIELNELPVVMAKSKDILEENMTLALEPKFVIPKVGAVGVENTYVVTEKGLENLTVFPEEIQNF